MTRRNQTRRAFTLIELLVVLGIIVMLTALLMAGVSAVRIRQQIRTTEDIVLKVQTGIDNQVKVLNDQARADRGKRTPDYLNLVTYCGGDEDRAEALLMYLKLRHAFPQTYGEATTNVNLTIGAVTYINWPPHKAYATVPAISSWPPEQQSAALIYLALSSMAAGGNAFELDATNSAKSDFSLNGFTAVVFTDAWKNPICFKRFLSGVTQTELNLAPYTNVKTGFKDPWDTQGKLSTTNITTWTTAQQAAAQQAVGATFDNSNKTITAYSFGQDKQPGTLDDVFGYRLRKLGNKGAP